MILFTRTLQTGGLHTIKEHTTETETISFKFTDGHFVIDNEPDIRIGFELLRPAQHFIIGTEYYSLTICPHYGIDDDWRIEGLRADNEIWFTGTFDDCLTEFKRIEQLIREQGHTIDEPDAFNMEHAFRTCYKTRLGTSDFDTLDTPFCGIGDMPEKMERLKRRS